MGQPFDWFVRSTPSKQWNVNLPSQENIMKYNGYLLASSLVLISACSSVNSVKSPTAGNSDGLIYFLPKKDFLVVIKRADGKISDVELSTTPAYPDLTQPYALKFSKNYFGKNKIDIGINDSGLLTAAKSTTESSITEALKNLVTSAAQVDRLRMRSSLGETTTCNQDRDYTFVYTSSVVTDKPCGLTLTITAKTTNQTVDTDKAAKNNENKEESGVFYRQNIPYLITVHSAEVSFSKIVFSPSEAKTHFLPVAQTFFSNNDADFAFTDGVPTKYKQDTDGEAIALLKLPADVIGAYFAAVGSIFDSFKSKDEKEVSAMNGSLALQLAKTKYDACILAIEAKDDEKTKELGCDE